MPTNLHAGREKGQTMKGTKISEDPKKQLQTSTYPRMAAGPSKSYFARRRPRRPMKQSQTGPMEPLGRWCLDLGSLKPVTISDLLKGVCLAPSKCFFFFVCLGVWCRFRVLCEGLVFFCLVCFPSKDVALQPNMAMEH